jgi:hypothetical protein
MKRQEYTISYFVCPGCNNLFPIPRKKSRKRNKGHIKNLYCVFCGEIVKTMEVREGDTYMYDDGRTIYV